MARPTIDILRREVSQSVYRGRPIGAHEYFLEFSIEVPTTGCHIIHVALFDADSVTGNDQFASTNDALLPCNCLQAGTARTFWIGGAAPAPEASIMPPSSQGTQLTGLTGSWPDSDGPFDDTLEVFAQIKLYVCEIKECSGDEDCGANSLRRLGNPIATWTTFRSDVVVEDGTHITEGVGLLQQGASAGLSLSMRQGPSDVEQPPTAVALAASRRDRALASLHGRVRRLERLSEFPEPTEDSKG